MHPRLSLTSIFSHWANIKKPGSIKIVFLGESSSKDPVWLYRVEQMSQTARKYKNVEFKFRFAEGDYNQHVKMIEEEVNAGVDAIIGPWWDPVIYNDAITKAVKKDVFIYGLIGISPRLTLPIGIVKKIGWIETDWKEYGRQLAKIALRKIPNSTRILWPAEKSTSSYITDAIAGFQAGYAEINIAANITVEEVGFDVRVAIERISNYLMMNTTVNVIVTSGAIAIHAANRAVKNMGKKPKDITLLGQVISPESAQGIIDGFMPAGINIELIESSNRAIDNIFQVIKKKAKAEHHSVEFIEINKNNLINLIPSSLLPSSILKNESMERKLNISCKL